MAKEVAAAEEAPTDLAENRPLEINVWAPKFGFLLSRSSIATAAIAQGDLLYKLRSRRRVVND